MTPTVKIANPDIPGDFIVINESDFDAEKDRLWEEGDQAPAGPTDPEERLAAIRDAIAQLDPENPEHFTKDGKPQVAAIEAILGYNITAAERDAAMEPASSE